MRIHPELNFSYCRNKCADGECKFQKWLTEYQNDAPPIDAPNEERRKFAEKMSQRVYEKRTGEFGGCLISSEINPFLKDISKFL